jgi:hypothetical protein
VVGVDIASVLGAIVVGDGVVDVRVDGARVVGDDLRGLVLREPSMTGAGVLGIKVEGGQGCWSRR